MELGCHLQCAKRRCGKHEACAEQEFSSKSQSLAQQVRRRWLNVRCRCLPRTRSECENGAPLAGCESPPPGKRGTFVNYRKYTSERAELLR
eukprot:6209510-Pleurochrysis_carterae.AAC.2